MMLDKMRTQRIAIIGDSIRRNQWESMLCMLVTARPSKDSIYEVNESLITKHIGSLVFRFEDYKCIVEYYRFPYLVMQGSSFRRAPKSVRMALKLDQMTWARLLLEDADVLVFNNGHWWRYEKTKKHGCYFQKGQEMKMEMDLGTVFQKSIKTLVDFVTSQVDKNKIQVLFFTPMLMYISEGAPGILEDKSLIILLSYVQLWLFGFMLIYCLWVEFIWSKIQNVAPLMVLVQ
ncbi:hypothetical protein CRYUN_Cryun23aG0167700 [Craigia yunnanensis]